MKKIRVFVFLCLVIFIVLLLEIYFQKEILLYPTIPLFWSTNVSCYWQKSNGILELGAGEWDEAMLIPDRCIFFMEPTCFRDKGIGSAVLTPRQACAVESAAKMNPTSNIFLLYLTPNDFLEDSKKLVSILESYDNIYIRRIHFPTYISDSPLSKWYRKNLEEFLDADANPKSISDIIKFLTLWKNGGIYLDLDVIVQKRLNQFSNFVGAQDEEYIGTGIFGVDISTDLGRKVIESCLEEIKRGFKKYYWEFTNIITEVLQDLCNQEDAEDMTKEACQGFSVYPPNIFYPIPPEDWYYYFQVEKSNGILKKIRNAAIIKIWDEHSSRRKVSVNSTSPYNVAAAKYCPNIHKSCHSVI